MKKFNKNILLSVTGMSPAVVTETLYALVTEKGIIPTEIRVITTVQGKNKLLAALLGIEGGVKKTKGALAEFIEDYGEQYHFSHIHFDESCIELIKDNMGNPLPDIRTPKENQLASDQIVNLVAKLCANPENAIHVSIAGGRKTMGFFLGYALSLYGREQDTLSHVLISEEFETVPNFYYPTPKERFLNSYNGRSVNAQNAQVMLAEIPWVRLELGVPEGLRNSEISYSDSVQKAQSILETPKITFLSPIDEQKVLFGETMIKLSPRGYSLLLSLAILKKQSLSVINENLLKGYYLPIHKLLKGNNDSLNSRLTFKDPTGKDLYDYQKAIKDILSESRHDIVTKIKKAFSINRTDIPYIPKSSNSYYELLIDNDNIDLSKIEKELSILEDNQTIDK
ncbi:CRISPR-associated ring nuclease Csm6 [Gallibacterium genomosp. 3]|uniref:CRISPR-associated protein n=1 Tax=Gallibacterium genomosp. 3 TaxID=505345 RepID=A0A1A7Q7G0_9PAST|nr:CRISPR-associated ring nuclease Csm6 [Gallibacterium genomosp. 3]OBX09350.1 CRISPR-associated protein [Gallibacterium genomosp. 3]